MRRLSILIALVSLFGFSADADARGRLRERLFGGRGGPYVAAPAVEPRLMHSAEVQDALDEVNAVRATSGLRPFILDDGLMVAARTMAAHRAKFLIGGHCNDFAAVPHGSVARAAGCGTSTGPWATCCTYENWTFAGAAWCRGSNGLRYMHLFCR